MTWHIRIGLFCLVMAALAADVAVARQAAQAAKLQVVKVSGNRRVESDAIRIVIKSTAGGPFSPDQVAADIKAIYALGFFKDVRAELEEQPGGTLELIFVVVEKPSIAGIKYRGNDELSLDKIKEVVDIKPLSVLDIGKILSNAEKIKELYVEKGFFLAEVTHELKDLPNNRVQVTFVIQERSKVEVKRITFIGNQNISSEELAGIMETRVGDFWSWLTSFGTFKQEAIKRDMMRLNEWYYNNGYINVKVSEPIIEISRDRASLYITIPIEEGEKYRFGNFNFAGDLLVPDEALLKRIEKALAEGGAGLVLSAELIRKLQKRMSDKEIGALKARVLLGLKAEVEQRISEGTWEEDRPASKPGDPLEEEVRTEYLVLLKTEILKDLLLIEPGEVFNRSKLAMSMFRIQDVYKDRGYAYVEVMPGTNIDAELRIADISFRIQQGKKVFIERIDIKGNLKTRDKVIRRRLRIYEGEYYSGTGMEYSRRLVNMLGFFEKVEISEKRGSAPDRIIITVEVKERPTGTFQIGAGFSSVENFIATAQISQQNLFGRGQTLALMAQLSSLRQFFSLNFIEPYFLDTNWYFGFQLFNRQLDYINFLRSASGGDITLGYEFADNWRFSTTYTLETVEVTTGRGTNQGLRLLNLFKDGWTSSLGFSVSWDTRDNRLFPTDGHLFQGSIEHAGEYTLSENNFTRLSGVARKYFPIFWGFVIKTNLTVGYITSTAEEGIPIFEKFFVGGIYTIRGYEPRSIGPSLQAPSNGWDPGSQLRFANIGGNKQLLMNLELEFPIFPQVNIRGVVFLDAGNAYGENEGFFSERYGEDPDDPEGRLKETWMGMYWSTGFGFRWFSPIGPLRFEWGIPLTRRPGDKDILFEFTIGNFF